MAAGRFMTGQVQYAKTLSGRMGLVDAALALKKRDLEKILRGLGRAVVAYSGGVDSALLAAEAHSALGDDALVVTAVSPSLARRERRAATELAKRFGWNHLEIETRELDRPEYARNDPDRCYWCKTELFEVLAPIADRHGVSVAPEDGESNVARLGRASGAAPILMGTNTDDLGDRRPGLRAARERDVLAPLADARLSKLDVRRLSAERGLPTTEKPASPCLASRFAYGVEVTLEGLERIDRAEEIVRGFGFDELRVRDHGDLARIEVPAARVAEVVAHRAELEAALRELGFVYVTVDLTGFRSGAMNEVLRPPTFRGIR